MAGIPGQQRRGGPGGGGRRGDCRKHQPPARADPVTDVPFHRPAEGTGGDSADKPQSRDGEADRGQQAKGPGADDQIAKVLGPKNGTERLRSLATTDLAGTDLAVRRLADAVRFNHCAQPPSITAESIGKTF